MKLLQLPEGLKIKALEIAEKEDVEAIWCEPCYGACDIPPQNLWCDTIVHYGHTRFMDDSRNIKYVEAREQINIVPILESHFNKIEQFDSIGIFSSLQFLDCIKQGQAFLDAHNKHTVIPQCPGMYEGQVLGCRTEAVRSIEEHVDCFLYIGSGRFHALGVALETEKPVFVLDVEKQVIESLHELKNKFMKQRAVAKTLAKHANVFGIIVSLKPGQNHMDSAINIMEQLRSRNKKAYILIMNEIKPEKIPPNIECLINTACPRIAIEDRALFKQPLLNVNEFEI